MVVVVFLQLEEEEEEDFEVTAGRHVTQTSAEVKPSQRKCE